MTIEVTPAPARDRGNVMLAAALKGLAFPWNSVASTLFRTYPLFGWAPLLQIAATERELGCRQFPRTCQRIDCETGEAKLALILLVATSSLNLLYTWALPILACGKRFPVFTSRRAKILIADDECLIADTLASILEQDGYEAVAVYGGRQAVEKANCWHPDLFLSDVWMPEVNGLQAAIEIREMFPECQILLFSGEPSGREIVSAARFRGYRFELLDKPIPPIDLLSRILWLYVA